MNTRALFASVHTRPEMFNLDGSYASMVAFLTGYDIGKSNVILRGFTEWLVARLGHETSLGWTALCLNIAFPGKDRKFFLEPLDPEQNSHAVNVLFQLLDDFLENTSPSAH